MGHRTVWVCDWCSVEEPESIYNNNAPETWKEVNGELMCSSCLLARSGALASARKLSAARFGRPTPSSTEKP